MTFDAAGDPSQPHTHGGPFVDDLFVAPRCQRMGVGAALLDAAEHRLGLAASGQEAVLACLEAATGAHAFYERRGWALRAGRAFTAPEDGYRYRVYGKALALPGVDSMAASVDPATRHDLATGAQGLGPTTSEPEPEPQSAGSRGGQRNNHEGAPAPASDSVSGPGHMQPQATLMAWSHW